jgi:hypothetical protein
MQHIRHERECDIEAAADLGGRAERHLEQVLAVLAGAPVRLSVTLCEARLSQLLGEVGVARGELLQESRERAPMPTSDALGLIYSRRRVGYVVVTDDDVVRAPRPIVARIRRSRSEQKRRPRNDIAISNSHDFES